MTLAPPALSLSALAVRSSVFAELAPHIEARARAGGDLVALHIGDTHVPPPPGARFGAVDPGDFEPAVYGYGSTSGVDALREAFVARLARLGHGPPGVEGGKHVLVACGATHAAFCVLRSVLDPGDEVLVASPYWPLTVGVVRAAGGIPVEVPLTTRIAETSFDAGAALEGAITPRTKAMYLITPNNPDGTVLPARALASIARVAIARGLWVLSDEVYADYAYDAPHVSIARLEGMPERTLSVYSLSKSHALAGARVGFAVAPERVIAVARRIATHTVFNVPVASQRVAMAAVASPDAWLDDTKKRCRAARDAAVEALRGSGAKVPVPGGGSYLFVDFAPVLGGRPLRELLERAIDRGVLVAPGDAFGQGYEAWARICFTSVDEGRLALGLGRLREAMGGA